MIRRPPRSTHCISSAASDVYKRQQYILSATENKIFKPSKKIKFQGVFGVVSEKNGAFDYLYLGKGNLIQNGVYKIEVVSGMASAELKLVDGEYYYTSDTPISIQLKEGQIKTYPAGYNIKIK